MLGFLYLFGFFKDEKGGLMGYHVPCRLIFEISPEHRMPGPERVAQSLWIHINFRGRGKPTI